MKRKTKHAFQYLLTLLQKYLNSLVVLCGGTFAYGTALLQQFWKPNSPLDLFPPVVDIILVPLFYFFPTLYFFGLWSSSTKRTKIALMGMLLLWLTLFWGYWNHPLSNLGTIQTGIMVVLCYLALYHWEDRPHE